MTPLDHSPRPPRRGSLRGLPALFTLLGFVLLASPASAQWTRVAALPATDMFSVRVRGDTIAAAIDTAVFVSTDGTTWHRSARLAPAAPPAFALWIRNGRLYAGTGGQGVFVSNDLGTTWQAFNQGLVGGIFDSQLDVSDLAERGDSLFVATLGAGVYARSLNGGGWSPFGDAFEPSQSPNVSDLALGGTRLMASAGSNGTVLVRDPGAPDWTLSVLGNPQDLAGVSPHTAFFTGTRWVLGTNAGVFLSATGSEPWQKSATNLAGAGWATFAQIGSSLYAALDFLGGAIIVRSEDQGTTWEILEGLPGSFVYGLESRHSLLYAARNDGLFVRADAAVSVPAPAVEKGLTFALVGAQPVGDRPRLSFVLPEAASAVVDVFDLQGRIVAPPVEAFATAGTHELQLDAHALPAGVYLARLRAAGRSAVVRLVRVR